MSIKDMIDAAHRGKPADFAAAVQDELNNRIMDSIEGKRREFADTIFAKDHEEIDMGQGVEPEEEEDFDEDV